MYLKAVSFKIFNKFIFRKLAFLGTPTAMQMFLRWGLSRQQHLFAEWQEPISLQHIKSP